MRHDVKGEDFDLIHCGLLWPEDDGVKSEFTGEIADDIHPLTGVSRYRRRPRADPAWLRRTRDRAHDLGDPPDRAGVSASHTGGGINAILRRTPFFIRQERGNG